MKKFLGVVLFGLLGLNAFAADSIKFATGDWEPYTGQKMPGYGLVSEMVSAACEAAGIKPIYEFFPWKRAESNVEGGDSFATFPYQKTPERESRFMFSEVLVNSSNLIMAHKGNSKTATFEYNKPENLKGYSVGIVVGSDAVKNPLMQAGARAEEAPSDEVNLKKLEADRVDFVIDDMAVLSMAVKAAYGANPEKMAEFRSLKQPFGVVTGYRLMVSRKYPNAKVLLERFDAGLAKIQANGTYKAILKKYGM